MKELTSDDISTAFRFCPEGDIDVSTLLESPFGVDCFASFSVVVMGDMRIGVPKGVSLAPVAWERGVPLFQDALLLLNLPFRP